MSQCSRNQRPQLAALTELFCTDGMWAVNVRRLVECVCGTCEIKHLAYERIRGSEAGLNIAFRQPLAYQLSTEVILQQGGLHPHSCKASSLQHLAGLGAGLTCLLTVSVCK